MALLNFNAQSVTPDTGALSAVPKGWYNVKATNSEMKPTKAGDGAYLEVEFTILDGQYANRKLFARFNLQNANPTAQEIGYKQLSAFAHAVGVLMVQDSQQLHGIPLKVKVKVRAETDEYEASNDIAGYKNINEDVGAMGGQPAAGGVQNPGMGGGFPQQAPAPQPWQQSAPAAQPQYAPQAPQQPMQQPQAPQGQSQWQQPQGQQPWQQPGQPQQAQQAQQPQVQPQQAFQQQPMQQPQQMQPAPWQQGQQPQQQPMQQQPVQQPAAAGAMPPWMQQPGQQ